MKRIPGMAAALLVILTACSDKKESSASGMSAKAQKNLAAMRTVARCFESGDAAGIDSAIAADYTDHGYMGDMGRDSLKSMIVQMHAKDPGMKMETMLEFANDDWAIAQYKITGTGDGTMGNPKGPYTWHTIELAKMNADSKAVEHWEYLDSKEMMQMMQMMKGGEGMPTDTTGQK